MLLAQGALLKCSSLLVSLGAAVAEGNKEEGMELVGKIQFTHSNPALLFYIIGCFCLFVCLLFSIL